MLTAGHCLPFGSADFERDPEMFWRPMTQELMAEIVERFQ